MLNVQMKRTLHETQLGNWVSVTSEWLHLESIEAVNTYKLLYYQCFFLIRFDVGLWLTDLPRIQFKTFHHFPHVAVSLRTILLVN